VITLTNFFISYFPISKSIGRTGAMVLWATAFPLPIDSVLFPPCRSLLRALFGASSSPSLLSLRLWCCLEPRRIGTRFQRVSICPYSLCRLRIFRLGPLPGPPPPVSCRGWSSLPQCKSDPHDVTEELGMLGGVHGKYIGVSNTCGSLNFPEKKRPQSGLRVASEWPQSGLRVASESPLS
jgi:hypothetical protein